MFYLMRTNRAGYESVWCNDGEWHGLEFCKFPFQRALSRRPSIKTWKTRAGVERWLNERYAMRNYVRVMKVGEDA